MVFGFGVNLFALAALQLVQRVGGEQVSQVPLGLCFTWGKYASHCKAHFWGLFERLIILRLFLGLGLVWETNIFIGCKNNRHVLHILCHPLHGHPHPGHPSLLPGELHHLYDHEIESSLSKGVATFVQGTIVQADLFPRYNSPKHLRYWSKETFAKVLV